MKKLTGSFLSFSLIYVMLIPMVLPGFSQQTVIPVSGFENGIGSTPPPAVTLPFMEPWDQGTFTFNNWEPTGNWSISTSSGNPAPCADFSGNPPATGYSHTLLSPGIDATAWTCAKIWLDFDVMLIDSDSNGTESLFVDLFYDNLWHQKMVFSNHGNTGWSSRHINIGEVKGKTFRIRFTASGLNSGAIHHWLVDNIHVYGKCRPPLGYFTYMQPNTTVLSWEAPQCSGMGPSILEKLFQWSGTPDNGYYQNYNYGYGVAYDLYAWPEAILKKIDFHHSSWGINGTWQYKIHVVDWTTFNEIATLGPMLTSGNDTWENDVPLGDIPDIGGGKIAIILEPLSNSPTNAYPCFSADNQGPDGWSVMGLLPGYSSFEPSQIGDFLQNLWIEVPVGDGKALIQPEKLISHSASFKSADSSILLGYNIYRTADNGALPFTILNPEPITELSYYDLHPATTWPWTWWNYFVTAVYKNSIDNTILCEASTDTLRAWFSIGIDELNATQVSVFPNPASDFVDIRSEAEILDIEALNYRGHVVYRNQQTGRKEVHMIVSDWPVGLYLLKITTSLGSRMAKVAVIR